MNHPVSKYFVSLGFNFMLSDLVLPCPVLSESQNDATFAVILWRMCASPHGAGRGLGGRLCAVEAAESALDADEAAISATDVISRLRKNVVEAASLVLDVVEAADLALDVVEAADLALDAVQATDPG